MFKFGDVVRVVEAADTEPVLGFVQKVEGDLVDVVKIARGVVSEVKGLIGHKTLAEAQVEGAGEHHSHTVAPLVDVEPAPAVADSSVSTDSPVVPVASTPSVPVTV